MRIIEITEMASYPGNIGIMELAKFFQSAPPELVAKVKELMDKGAKREVWQIVQKYTGTKLKGKEFEAAINEVIRKLPSGDYRLYSKKGKNLGTYPSKSGAEKRERQVQYFKHNESLDEAFDQPYPITMRKSEGGDYDGVTKLADGSNLEITIDLVDEGFEGMDTFDVSFYRGGTTDTTGEGDAFKVFATVMSAIKQFIMQYRRDSEDGKSPYMITFSASKSHGDAPGGNAQSRAKLYDRMVKRFANQMGYNVYVEDYEVSQEYELTRKR